MDIHTRLTTAALMGFVLIAASACGGGSDGLTKMEEEALQQQVEDAAAAQAEAEQAAAEAERKRQEAEQAAKQAEAQRQAAEEQRQAAQEAEQAAEEARQAAEAERQRLEAEAEKARQAANAERARVAISGTRMIGDDANLAVGAIEHGVAAPVTNPTGPFTTTTSSSGRWAITAHTVQREATRDTVEIYTDVEAPTREPFSTSAYNSGNAVVDGTGMVVGHVDIVNANHGRVTASGSFPRSIGPAEPFSLVDRGLDESAYTTLALAADGSATDAELDTAGITRQQYNQYRQDRGFRDTDKFPQRYAYTTSGTLQGAGGTYRCDGDAATDTCTVQNRGGSFQFVGDWDFIPSSGTVTIVVPDGQYMWFGWWARQTVEHSETTPDHPTDIWAFQAEHGGNAVTNLADATGTATYQGPAAGRYAIYEPDTGDSSIGSFTASATLQADFDSTPNTVAGVITGFSNDPSWSLALKRSDITGGNAAVATNGVTWSIDGVPDDSGAWEATFYANLPTTAGTVDYQPHGIAGTFEAAYDGSGVGTTAVVIGGFGAHR